MFSDDYNSMVMIYIKQKLYARSLSCHVTFDPVRLKVLTGLTNQMVKSSEIPVQSISKRVSLRVFRPQYGKTCLHVAIEHNRQDIVQLLVER